MSITDWLRILGAMLAVGFEVWKNKASVKEMADSIKSNAPKATEKLNPLLRHWPPLVAMLVGLASMWWKLSVNDTATVSSIAQVAVDSILMVVGAGTFIVGVILDSVVTMHLMTFQRTAELLKAMSDRQAALAESFAESKPGSSREELID